METLFFIFFSLSIAAYRNFLSKASFLFLSDKT